MARSAKKSRARWLTARANALATASVAAATGQDRRLLWRQPELRDRMVVQTRNRSGQFTLRLRTKVKRKSESYFYRAIVRHSSNSWRKLPSRCCGESWCRGGRVARVRLGVAAGTATTTLEIADVDRRAYSGVVVK